MDKIYYFICALLAFFLFPLQPAQALNSNKWPVYLSQELGFRISYPPSWGIIPSKGPNVRISVSPTDGPGNCNVVMQTISEINDYTQHQLNTMIDEMPLNIDTWKNLLNMPSSQFNILKQNRVKANQVSAIYGVIEIQIDSLTGKYFRKQNVVFMLTPGKRWSVTCGVSTYKAKDGRLRYKQLEPYLHKTMESFLFLNSNSAIESNNIPDKGSTIEAIASQIANEHNKNSEKMTDNMTLSTSAKTDGMNVIFTNILNVKKGLSSQELKQFQTALYSEIVPGVCQQNTDNVAFEKGLYYTFVYYNNYNEKIAEIIVNNRTCANH